MYRLYYKANYSHREPIYKKTVFYSYKRLLETFNEWNDIGITSRFEIIEIECTTKYNLDELYPTVKEIGTSLLLIKPEYYI